MLCNVTKMNAYTLEVSASDVSDDTKFDPWLNEVLDQEEIYLFSIFIDIGF